MRRLPFILILLPCLLRGQTNINWTNIPQANLTLPLTAQALVSTNGATPVRRAPLSLMPFDASGAAQAATNGLGSAAFKAISFFDLAGSATAVTNGYPWGVLYDPAGAAQNSTNGIGFGFVTNALGYQPATNGNIVASSVAASNVFSGGQVQAGTIGANALVSDGGLLHCEFLGTGAGQWINGTFPLNVFIGYNAGATTTNTANSVFLGSGAGQRADGASSSVFIGKNTGLNAFRASSSMFLGTQAGQAATNANGAAFIGINSGTGATNATNSVFIGYASGQTAGSANDSIFIGKNSGTNRAATLWVDTQSTLTDGSYLPLLLGYFDLRQLFVNGSLTVTGSVTAASFSGTASSIAASNVFSGGVLPLGTVSSGITGFGGPMLTSNSVARFWTWNGGALTNLNGAQVVGPVPLAANVSSATLTNKVWATNVASGGQLPLGTVSSGLDSTIAGPMLTTNGTARFYSYNGGVLTNVDGISPGVSNWVTTLVGGVNRSFYFSAVTNALGVTTSTNCSTMIDFPVAAAATNNIAIPSSGVYFLSRVSTNTVTRVEEGPISLDTYVFVSGGGGSQSVTAHPEMWIWFTNNTMVQIASAGQQTISKGTDPVHVTASMNVSFSTNLTSGAHLLLRWFADGIAGSPTWNFIIGGNYDSHISVNTGNNPVGSYTGTFSGDGSGLTNVTASVQYPTNSMGQAPTFSFSTGVTYGDFSTNAAFTFLSPVNVSTTNYQTCVLMVTNTTGSAVLATAPANCHSEGVMYVTNVSTYTFFNNPGKWTNCIGFPLY